MLLVKSASRIETSGKHSFITQVVSMSCGVFISFFLQFIDYKNLSKYWISISLFCTLIIVYTLIFGSRVTGLAGVDAKAWIKIPGGFSFQPSELAKIGFSFSFAKHLEIIKGKNKLNNFGYLLLFGLHVMVPVVLTHLQGDDGAAIIFICIAVFEMFIAGVNAKFFMFSLAIFALMIPLIWNFALAPYQKNRILNMMNPESDPYGIGFQQNQGKISIGSGGILGNGLFAGRRVGNGDVPIQESDFIISVAGEELGFVGCLLIIFLLVTLMFRIAYVAKNSQDSLGMIMCFGFLGLIFSQCVFNIGMCLSLLPVIGVTLPFFSAGGSSVMCLYFGIALVQSVYIFGKLNYIYS